MNIAQKKEMLEELRRFGIQDPVLKAMETVPREKFVPQNYQELAYADHPIPLSGDATISQPLVIAMMLQELQLKEGMHVLEIGSGSGYVVALIQNIVGKGQVTGIEIAPELVEESKEQLKALKIPATIICDDGSKGYKKNAPYDRILMSCSCEKVPQVLFDQLKEEGILVAPVGNWLWQTLTTFRKKKKQITQEKGDLVRFLPMRQRINQ